MKGLVSKASVNLPLVLQKMSEQSQDLNNEDDVKSLLKKTMDMLRSDYGLEPYLYRIDGGMHNIKWKPHHLSEGDVSSCDEKFIAKVTHGLSVLGPKNEVYYDGLNFMTIAGKQIEFISLKLGQDKDAVLFWAKQELDEIQSACLEHFLKQLVMSISSLNRLAKAQSLIHIDDLTGLYNYRYLEISLENEIKRWQRFGESFCVLFIDLDNFKPINDEHGHLSGSSVIKQVGELLTVDLRTVDSVYRYGGDEFVVLLLGVSLSRGYLVAERIRKKIEKTDSKL